MLLMQTVGVDGATGLCRIAGRQRRGNFLSGTGTRRGREKKICGRVTHLAFGALSGLHAVATLDHIGLQAYRTRPAVKLEEQAASVAKHRAEFVPAPQGRRGGAAVLADGL